MAIKYRLLKQDELIIEGDEFLSEDCVTWKKFTNMAIGSKFSHGNHFPGRREIKQPMTLTEAKELFCNQFEWNDDILFAFTKGWDWAIENEKLKQDMER